VAGRAAAPVAGGGLRELFDRRPAGAHVTCMLATALTTHAWPAGRPSIQQEAAAAGSSSGSPSAERAPMTRTLRTAHTTANSSSAMRNESLHCLMLSLAVVAPLMILMMHQYVLEPSSSSPPIIWPETVESEVGGSDDDDATDTGTTALTPQSLSSGTGPNAKATIAYAISLTGCDGDGLHVQGAAVLGHSIRLNSAANPQSTSQYGYKLFVFVHPDAVTCAKPFGDVGFEILIRETPVNVTDIRGEFLRTHVHKIGCCGEKEYLKLYSYQMTEYPVVVHFDMDCLLLRPLDDLFDAIIEGPHSASAKSLPVMFDDPLPEKIDAFFTRDYNMIKPGKKYPGFQGGFLVVRPSQEVFQEYREVILEGDFIGGAGWNGTFGGYWGAQQIQGLCSFYYDGIHPGTAVELNRCYYNQMVDSPVAEETGKCRDGKEECQDCRETKVVNIFSAHFTQDCGKPWECRSNLKPLCRDLVKAWHAMRRNWDNFTSGDLTVPALPTGNMSPETFLGNCKGAGARNYIPFQLLDGKSS